MQLISGVQHAGEVLRLFTPAEPEWGAADVSRALAMSRSHAHRLLSTLAAIGLLDRVNSNGHFRLSWRWFSYASITLASDRLVKAGMPVLRALVSERGVESTLAVWDHQKVLALHATPAPMIVRAELEDSGPAGLVLMAGMAEEDVKDLVTRAGARNGLLPQSKVDRYVRHVRSGGVLTSGAASPGSQGWSAAAPVMDEQRNVVAALAGTIDDASAFSENHVAEVVKNAARLVTASLVKAPLESADSLLNVAGLSRPGQSRALLNSSTKNAGTRGHSPL
ncbi:IclR family transcriptional regulator [Conyzicola sp.]|uniref:IclR family transcriptional regulator n=1 Tax=Conyzicola sp. TaxID=1969404 RepID=UPI00398928F1